MAKGQARFDPPSRSSDEFSSVLGVALADSSDVGRADSRSRREPSADSRRNSRASAVGRCGVVDDTSTSRTAALYTVYATEQSLLFAKAAPSNDRNRRNVPFAERVRRRVDRVRRGCAVARKALGIRWVLGSRLGRRARAQPTTCIRGSTVSLPSSTPCRRTRASKAKSTLAKRQITIPTDGRYRVAATAVGPFGPDGLIAARVRRGAATPGVFPADFGRDAAVYVR